MYTEMILFSHVAGWLIIMRWCVNHIFVLIFKKFKIKHRNTVIERQKDKKAERPKSTKIERQKGRKAERQKDKKTERQKDRKVKRQKDRKTEG